jgi:DNA-binding transcriptional LysR family regulator
MDASPVALPWVDDMTSSISPSTASLRTFVEVARFRSFTRAAETLCLTQSAVSKQILALEDQVGVRLFSRRDPSLALTPAGEAYLPHVHEALAALEWGRTAAQLAAGRKEPIASVEIATSPAFAAQWLVPRLRGFRARAPQTRLVLRPRLPDREPHAERFDIEVRVGAGRWPDAQASYLMGREMALVASPALVGRQAASWGELQRLPLLHRAQRGYDWLEWSQALGLDWTPPQVNHLLFEGFSVLIPAVTAGLGLAICPLFLVIDQLEEGSLMRPLGECVNSREAFHCVRFTGTPHSIARDRLIDWLHDEARLTNQRIQDHLRPRDSSQE